MLVVREHQTDFKKKGKLRQTDKAVLEGQSKAKGE